MKQWFSQYLARCSEEKREAKRQGMERRRIGGAAVLWLSFQGKRPRWISGIQFGMGSQRPEQSIGSAYSPYPELGSLKDYDFRNMNRCYKTLTFASG